MIGLCTLLWSSDSFFRVNLLTKIDAISIVFFEHCITSVVMLPFFYVYWRQLLHFSRKDWLQAVIIGAGGSALGLFFFTQAFSLINPSIVILLQKSQPIFAILTASFFLRERLPQGFWPLACVAIAGSIILSFPELKNIELNWNSRTLTGILYTLFTSILWGSSTTAGRGLLLRTSPHLVAALRMNIGMLSLAVLVFLLDKPIASAWHQLTIQTAADQPRGVFYLFLAALIPGLAAMVIYYYGLARVQASRAAFVEVLYPLWAVILNWIAFGYALSSWQILGGLILIGSSIAIQRLPEKQI